MIPRTILITGAAGYIGSHVAQLFLRQGMRVIALDNLSRGYRQALEELNRTGDLVFFEGDIHDAALLDSVFSDYTVEAVFHLAALCLPDESVGKPLEYYAANTLGTISILEAMKRNKADRLVFASTCAVYGETKGKAVDESHELRPINPYGHSKLLAEEAIRHYSEAYGIRSVIFRFFNVCGADATGAIGDSKKPSQLLMQNAVRGGLGIEPFSYTCAKVDTPDGTPIRDYIDVRDLAAVHASAMPYLETAPGSEAFNLGAGRGYSVKEIVSQVERTLGVPIEKHQARPRRGEQAAVSANPGKAQALLGWKAEKSLEDSIAALAAWYRRKPKGFSY